MLARTCALVGRPGAEPIEKASSVSHQPYEGGFPRRRPGGGAPSISPRGTLYYSSVLPDGHRRPSVLPESPPPHGVLDSSSQSFLVLLGHEAKGPSWQRDSAGTPEAEGQGEDTEACESQGQGQPSPAQAKGAKPGLFPIPHLVRAVQLLPRLLSNTAQKALPTALPPGLGQHRAGSWDNAGLSCTGGLHPGVLDHVFNCKQPGQARDSTADLDLRWEQCGGGGGLVTVTCRDRGHDRAGPQGHRQGSQRGLRPRPPGSMRGCSGSLHRAGRLSVLSLSRSGRC